MYKYMSVESGMKYLQSWRLRYTVPREFNDPFDVLPAARDVTTMGKHELDPEMLHLLLGNYFGLLCFTRTSKHLLMWAHYADCHRGMLMEFDDAHPCFNRQNETSKFIGRLHPVIYSDERPSYAEATPENLKTSFLTKSLEWSHEQELRLLWPVSRPDAKAGPLLFYDVPAAALKRVVLGCRADESTQAAVVEAIAGCSVSAHVVLQRALVRKTDFSLDYTAVLATASASTLIETGR